MTFAKKVIYKNHKNHEYDIWKLDVLVGENMKRIDDQVKGLG